jgi:glyoxylase-like metal-dependent hydrolase (beta-lactamase superfamily II)
MPMAKGDRSSLMEKMGIKLSVTNCYLLETPSHKYVLIDTGYVDEWDLFCKRLGEIGVSLTDISHIILTHHHDDHCGLLNKIIQTCPEIQIVMSNHAQDLLLVGKNDRRQAGGLINRRVKLVLSMKQLYISWVLKKKVDKKNNLRFPPYHARENDILVREEITLKEVGIDLPGRITLTPGHSNDCISILLGDGDCFVGDAAANFLRFAGTKYCVIYVSDLETYYQSWQKIISENARNIYPAHGKPFPVERLIENIGKNKAADLVKD